MQFITDVLVAILKKLPYRLFLSISYYHTHYARYAVMKKCWRLAPSDRPTFSELAATLDKTLMSVAGYTELGMTLVEGGGEEEEWGAGYEPVDPPNEAGLGEAGLGEFSASYLHVQFEYKKSTF